MTTSLAQISRDELSSMPLPSKLIHSDSDVLQWTLTSGYQQFMAFMRQLNHSVKGHRQPSISSKDVSHSVRKIEALLKELETWIEEIPPMNSPQRFGNLSFRTWGDRLVNNASRLLENMLSPDLKHAIPYLAPYLVESFGNQTRMDYGTGHEAAWMMFLCALARIGYLDVSSEDPQNRPHLGDSYTIPLYLFPRYLSLTWLLQDRYNLEPAGSHGVWGLDDSSFVGYIFGSSQMCGQDDLPPNSVLQYIKVVKQIQTAKPLRTLSSSSDVDASDLASGASLHRSFPDEPISLYHLMLWRILQIKSGPFFEHSSQLYNIAAGVQTWTKVNEGMQKMYMAEVLGKRVVVQHIPLGGLLPWDPPSHSPGQRDVHRTSHSSSRTTNRPTVSPPTATTAPWKSTATAIPPVTSARR